MKKENFKNMMMWNFLSSFIAMYNISLNDELNMRSATIGADFAI